jgi:hypothetical protein
VLSEYERRALEELERSYRTPAREPVGCSSPPGRRPGIRVVAVLACLSVGLLVTGAASAALAIAVATGIGWSFWRLWSSRADGPPVPARAGRQPGTSVRGFLAWLTEAD